MVVELGSLATASREVVCQSSFSPLPEFGVLVAWIGILCSFNSTQHMFAGDAFILQQLPMLTSNFSHILCLVSDIFCEVPSDSSNNIVSLFHDSITLNKSVCYCPCYCVVTQGDREAIRKPYKDVANRDTCQSMATT